MSKKEKEPTLLHIFDSIDSALDQVADYVNSLGPEIILGVSEAQARAKIVIAREAMNKLNAAAEAYSKLLPGHAMLSVYQLVASLSKNHTDSISLKLKETWLKESGKANELIGLNLKWDVIVQAYEFGDMESEFNKVAGLIHDTNSILQVIDWRELWNEKEGKLVFTEKDEAAIIKDYSVTAGEQDVDRLITMYLFTTAINRWSHNDRDWKHSQLPEIPFSLYRLLDIDERDGVTPSISKYLDDTDVKMRLTQRSIEVIGMNESGLPLLLINGEKYQFTVRTVNISLNDRAPVLGESNNNIDLVEIAKPEHRATLIRVVDKMLKIKATALQPLTPRKGIFG